MVIFNCGIQFIKGQMQLTGICSVCQRPGLLYSCMLCGALVCREHYDASRGICVHCAEGRAAPGVSPAESEDRDEEHA
jgi:hypothetical protein